MTHASEMTHQKPGIRIVCFANGPIAIHFDGRARVAITLERVDAIRLRDKLNDILATKSAIRGATREQHARRPNAKNGSQP